MKLSIKRIYHPYWLWEEVDYNMWGKVDNDKEGNCVIKCINFMKNTDLFGKYMIRVAKEWRFSCEHNLSNLSSNRRAWIGQASCALKYKVPENVVRASWGELSEEKRLLANRKADVAIRYWEMYHAEKITRK